ncbi:MAG TPA: hypothetical protein ENN29_03220 [Candidatus Hydrogenedentes bacterium]|nr:hypothetical protein [Candidatus Hydrogenedentota bacterium]
MMTVFILAVGVIASTSDAYNAPLLGDGIDGNPATEMMNRYFLEQAAAFHAARAERYETLKTPENIAAYQKMMTAFFLKRLGGFPDRTPLNARTVDSGEREHFRFEKVLFESRPGHYVTGLLYLPKTPGPWPGVIVPCGHSANGKANDGYQRASMLLATNGIAAFCYDPIGQGERYAYLKADGTPEFGATLEHTLLGVGAILTGTNTAAYRIWDGMRAIDYLQGRDDIIADRIGCTGNSGGGTLTSYLMALDERIVCAAPSCYLTSFDRLLNTIGAQDAEQNIFGQVAFGMDHADYIHQRAPKPTLMCAATQDFFDITGTWNTFREAKRLFARLGFAERVDIIEHDDKHGFAQPLREGAARWMSRWLLEQDRVITEPNFDVFSDEEALCTPDGQVMLLENAVSVLDLNAMRAQSLRGKRAAFRRGADDDAFRDKVRELIAFDMARDAKPEVTTVGGATGDGRHVKYLVIIPESGIALPAALITPDAFTGDFVLALHEAGKDAVVGDDGMAEALLEAGHAVLAIDLRGTGETQGAQNPKGWRDYIGSNWQDFFFAYLLGKSFVGMRAQDIAAAASYLHDQAAACGKSLRLIAVGGATVPALHAAALRPELFSHVSLRDGIPGWDEVARTPRAKQQLINVVHDALSWYDLPDLAALLPENTLEIINPHIPAF